MKLLRNLCKDVLPFSEIPSPKTYPVIGHAYLFSGKGPYHKDKLTEAAYDLSRKYGPVYYLKFPGQSFVITTDPENAAKIFQNEGKFPNRVTLPAMALYHKRSFDAVGVVPDNGPNWYKLRKALSPLLMKTYISKFIEDNELIADKFVEYIRKQRDENNKLVDLCSHMYRYSIECMSIVCPGRRLSNEEDINKIIEGSCTFMDGLYRTYSEPPVWKFIKTKGYKRLEHGHTIINRFMYKEMNRPIDEWNDSFMKVLFQDSNLTLNEARVLSTEVFLSGIDSISTTITMTLYYLSKNEKCQKEALSDVNKGSLSYLRACVKEALRLSATAGGTTRALPVDVTMNGYNIPANTNITAFHSAMSLMEEYFEDAESFKPERWSHSEKVQKKNEFSNFASLPFGHGPRMCPGRWLSEQESVILLRAILKSYRLESDTPSKVGMIYRMNRIPERSIDIKFLDRQ